jgi:hypothetical protein
VAKVTNAFTTYDAKANREDLSDIIYNIDPFDTPMMTAAGRRNVSNIVYDWQTESLPAVSVTGELEGFELARAASTPTVRVSDVCQINARDATVSGTQDAANPAGKRRELAHQIALVGKALKRDCESVLFGTIAQVKTLGDATTVRKTTGLINWLATNSVFQSGGSGADPVQATATAAVDDETPILFTEAALNNCIQLCYESGAEPSLLFVGPYNKRIVSTFVGRANSRQMIAAKKVVNSVTMYASDFGDLKVLPTRWIRPRDAFLMDPRYFKVAFYRNFQRSSLGRIGDATTELILTEYGLQVDNEAAHGVIRDLTIAA